LNKRIQGVSRAAYYCFPYEKALVLV